MARRKKSKLRKITRRIGNRFSDAIAVISGGAQLAKDKGTPTKNPVKASRLDEEYARAENQFGSFFGSDTYREKDKIIRLKGRSLFEFYDQIVDTDAILAGTIETRIDSVARLPWDVIPASDDPRDIEIAENVKAALLALDNFDEDITELLGACRNGYAVSEIVWADTEINGKMMLVPDRILSKPPDWFRFDVDGNIYFVGSSMSSGQGELMPPYKFIHYPFRPRYQNPYGTSLLRAVYWAYWFKHIGFEQWMRALERGAVSTPMAGYAEDANQDEQDQLAEHLKIFLKSKYLLYNQKHKIDMLEPKMDSNFGDVLIQRCNLEMIYRILGGTQSSTTDKTGSRAQGETHEKQLQKRIENDSKAIAAKLNNTVIRWIVELNYPDVKAMPTFKQRYEESKDILTMVKALEAAALMGIPISIEDGAKLLDLPLAEEGEELIHPPDPLGGTPILGGNEDEDKETEDESEEEPEEDADAETNRTRQRFIRLARKARAEAIREFKDKLSEASYDYGIGSYDEFADQIDLWLQARKDVEDALAEVDSFRLDTKKFKTLMNDSVLWSLLNGMFVIFDLPKFKKHLKNIAPAPRLLTRYKPMKAADAIAHFEKRKVLTREEFDLLEAWARRHAFTAARLAEETIEGKLKPALAKALEEGMTIKQFQGVVRDVVINDLHAENIFRTNTATSFVQGNMEAAFTEAGRAAIPAFEYMAVVDDRTTATCLERDGQIYRGEDAERLDIVPPLHYMCRSDLVPVFEDEWDGKSADPPKARAMEGFGRWKSALT